MAFSGQSVDFTAGEKFNVDQGTWVGGPHDGLELETEIVGCVLPLPSVNDCRLNLFERNNMWIKSLLSLQSDFSLQFLKITTHYQRDSFFKRTPLLQFESL